MAAMIEGWVHMVNKKAGSRVNSGAELFVSTFLSFIAAMGPLPQVR